MNKILSLAVGLALTLPMLATAADAAAAGKPRTERGQLVHDIVAKWGGHVQEAYGADVGRWADGLGPRFAKADLAALRQAAGAATFDGMARSLTAKADGVVTPQDYGDVDTDLVYVPVTPCRIFDTRANGGPPISANSVRGIDVTAVSSYNFQGGANNDCGGVGAAGSFAAAVINLTVVSPAAAGYITAFPTGGSQPTAATVNYAAGDIVGNLAIVRLDQGAAANEMNIYSYAATHLVGDIVGYFIQAPALALSCVDTAATVVTVAAGSTANSGAPTCAAGSTQTATNCESSTWQMPFVYFKGGTCSAQNNSGGTATLRATRTCCRITGG